MSLAAAASPGCGPPQARPLIAEGRWAEACAAVYPADPLTPSEVRDIERWEFDDLVVERSGARVGVLAIPRHVAEHVLGASPRVRASPQHAQGIVDDDWLTSLTARRFASEYLLLAWRAESSGPLHAEIGVPALARRLGKEISGTTTAVTLEDEAQVARAFGFLRSPGSCDNSLLSVAGRLFESVRDSSVTALCREAAGRDPTPEEKALAAEIASRLIHPCPAGSAACTGYGFVRSVGDDTPESQLLDVRVRIPVGGACEVTDFVRLPLSGVTTVAGAGGALRALFPAGPRPLAELRAQDRAQADAPLPVPTPVAGPASPGHRCEDREACKRAGRCHDQAGHCVLGADADCRASELCAVEGWCSLLPGKTPLGDAFLDSVCGARTDADCASSEACRVGGFCRAEAGRCVAGSAADCASSEACARFGLCSFAGGACRAASGADCERSILCKEWHACRAEAGLCR